jgi:glycosyltransferase involved in cell wall biosynthesis
MRVLVLNHEYPPIGGGGGQACKNIIDELIQRGYETTLITAHYKDLLKEETSGNPRIFRVPSLRKYPFRVGLFGMGAYIFNSVLLGLKIIREWKPQIIHVHFAVPAGFAAFVLHTFTRIPYILTVHLGDVPGGVPEKTDRWFRYIFPFTKPIWKNAAEIAAVSAFTGSLAKKHYTIEPRIIPNGMRINPTDPILKLNTPPTIVFAGRFMPQKNLLVFIDILNSVQDLNWKCVMLGDGPLFQSVSEKIKELSIADRFALPGWVNTTDVITTFRKSDILLMPSLSEGLSVVGVQALVAGLAIIANNVGGFTDLVESNENGFIAEIGDVAALTTAMRRYLSNPDSLLKARQKSLIFARKFDIRQVVDSYEEIYARYALS